MTESRRGADVHQAANADAVRNRGGFGRRVLWSPCMPSSDRPDLSRSPIGAILSSVGARCAPLHLPKTCPNRQPIANRPHPCLVRPPSLLMRPRPFHRRLRHLNQTHDWRRPRCSLQPTRSRQPRRSLQPKRALQPRRPPRQIPRAGAAAAGAAGVVAVAREAQRNPRLPMALQGPPNYHPRPVPIAWPSCFPLCFRALPSR